MKKEDNKKTSTIKEKKVEVKKKEVKKVENKNEKKENIFKKILKYFKGVGKEINRIKWTNGKDLVKYSIATVCFVLFFGLYFYAIDWLVLLVRSLAK